MEDYNHDLKRQEAEEQQPLLSYTEEFDSSNPVVSFLHTISQLVLQPAKFFTNIPRQGTLLNPLLFTIICGEIATLLEGLLTVTGVLKRTAMTQELESLVKFLHLKLLNVPDVSFSVVFLGLLVITPISISLGILVLSSILNLAVSLVIGKKSSGYKTSVRIWSYATVVQLVGWMPISGILPALYVLYLHLVGVREMYQTTTSKAALVIVVEVLIVVLPSLLLYVFLCY